MIKPDQIKKGDRLIIRDGCGFSPKVDIEWEDGTVLAVLTIGLKGMYLNQRQVKKLGDNRCAAWGFALVSINRLKTKPLDVGDRPWIEWTKVLDLQVLALATVGAFAIPFDRLTL